MHGLWCADCKLQPAVVVVEGRSDGELLQELVPLGSGPGGPDSPGAGQLCAQSLEKDFSRRLGEEGLAHLSPRNTSLSQSPGVSRRNLGHAGGVPPRRLVGKSRRYRRRRPRTLDLRVECPKSGNFVGPQRKHLGLLGQAVVRTRHSLLQSEPSERTRLRGRHTLHLSSSPGSSSSSKSCGNASASQIGIRRNSSTWPCGESEFHSP